MPKNKVRMICAALLLALILTPVFAFLYSPIKRDIRESSRTAIRDTVLRCAAECYAAEGAYPDSLDYLENNYGLIVNHDKFIVAYEVYASNQLPYVQVLVRGEG